MGSRFGLAALALLSSTMSSCGGGGGGGDDARRGGTLFFSQDGNSSGLFTLDTRTGAATLVGVSNGLTPSGGLTEGPSASILWGTTKDDVVLISADGSGATTLAGTAGAEGLAFHEPDGLLYATEDGLLYTVHPVTGLLLDTLAPPIEDLEALASDAANDRIFAIGDSTLLFAYDVSSNTWSTIGDTGVNWDRGGLAYDPVAQVLYAVGEGGGENLHRIDPDTAAVTLVGPTGLSGTAGGLGFVLER